MTPTQYRELTGITEIRPSMEDMDELLKCKAYLRQTQILFEKLEHLYGLLVHGSLTEAEIHKTRGHIIALEEVVALGGLISAEAKIEARRKMPEGEERPDGEHEFRAALNEQKEKNHV